MENDYDLGLALKKKIDIKYSVKNHTSVSKVWNEVS
jgi:hypothetical protein